MYKKVSCMLQVDIVTPTLLQVLYVFRILCRVTYLDSIMISKLYFYFVFDAVLLLVLHRIVDLMITDSQKYEWKIMKREETEVRETW